MFTLSLNSIHKILKHNINCIFHNLGEIIIEANYKKIKKVLIFFKDHESCLYKLLIDIIVVDFPENSIRFKIIYNICSIKHNVRVKIITQVDETNFLESLANIYKNASWIEREIFDLYGIYFDLHPDLRRILTDYGFDGFPLRKDFPLTGYKELRYDSSQKRVITELLELSQEFRVFKFNSPWSIKSY